MVRKPYDIGDKVCFLDPNSAVDNDGPPGGGWLVENVDLYTTTVRQGTTREYATFANGSLSNSRIINLRRSDKPNIYMYLKFPLDISKEQLRDFRKGINDFIRDRPREWVKLISLRCTTFEVDSKHLKFTLILQHRESWQSHGAIQVSKSKMYIHALLLQKKLQMDFSAPKAPVELPEAPPKSVDIEDLVVRDPLAPNESESFESTQVMSTSSVDGPLFRRKGTRSAGESNQEVRDVEKSKDK